MNEKHKILVDWFNNLFDERTKLVEEGTADIDMVEPSTRVAWSEETSTNFSYPLR
jgi:hypothetical protein